MLMAAAPTTMNTSRLMTAVVTQKGTGRCKFSCGGGSAVLLMMAGRESVTSAQPNLW
jgi:hypothetical protein